LRNVGCGTRYDNDGCGTRYDNDGGILEEEFKIFITTLKEI